MTTVYLNGKFLAQRITGVQRSAWQWLLALDELLAEEMPPDESWILLHPAGVECPALRAIRCQAVGRARPRSLHWWEQWSLPIAARGGLLVTLSGSAPWLARAQVVTMHDAAVFDHPQAYAPAFRWWYRHLFRHLARRARRVLTVSAFSRQRLLATLPLAAHRVAVVPNGADHLAGVRADAQTLERWRLQPGRFVLVVASANPTKNLSRLVEAFGRLPVELGLALVIVGGSDDQVFATPSSAGDGRAVRRTGTLDDAELKALYGAALLLAVPSIYEGFGLTGMEAMDCGCPVLAARAAALPEVYGDAAEYADPLSVDDLAAGLLRLATDPALAQRRRAEGHRRAEAFRWRTGAQRLRDEVRGVLAP